MSDLIETWKNDFRAFVNSLNLSRDDYKTMMEYIDEIPAVQPDHNADIGKKVSISCSRENDLISRQEALKELAAYIHLIDKTMGKGTLTDDDCMEAAKSVLGEDELPAVQPDNIADSDKKVCVDTISRQAALDTSKTGKWILKDDKRYHCSSCDGIAPKGYRWSFCPECGCYNGDGNYEV